MQPIQLVASNNPNVIRWMCPKCETIGADREIVSSCCSSLFCAECKQRLVVSVRDALCKDCNRGDRAFLQKTLFTKASKVYYHEYEIPYIYWEPEGKVGKFFRTKTHIEDWCVEMNIPTPTWVWGCKPSPIKFNITSLLPEDKHHLVSEEALMALQSQLDAWVAVHQLNTYTCDYDTAVVIDATLMSECKSAVSRSEDDAA